MVVEVVGFGWVASWIGELFGFLRELRPRLGKRLTDKTSACLGNLMVCYSVPPISSGKRR